MKKSVLPDLFLTFLKIGLFTFGGGYAMISIIEHDCVEKKRWITHDEMMNLTVIAESTPGPIAINCATYIGYQQAGLIGAAAATFAIVLPSFAIIYLICKMLDHFLEITVIANAFRGIQIAVGILIADVALHMIRKMPKDLPTRLIFGAAFGGMFLINLFSWNFSSITLMLLAGAAGLAALLIKDASGSKGGDGE